MLPEELMLEITKIRKLVSDINYVDGNLSWDYDYRDDRIADACRLLLEACDEAQRKYEQVDDVDQAWDEALSHDECLEQMREEREAYEVMAERNAERQHPIG